ncbi:polysaccharide deacetylase [Agrobacterium vitis]|uniref:Polysaccharide deacetylase n=1 Tax=Agrobacterium vitis TaxID=373 RepID=A0AAE4WE57_AGRVI|nr:polysaccharide deacetylase family protein [Agrobacterium vitis]MCF1497535.1 polysaccharide deacetylase [Allorhizobium sp. Av2]MCM2441576.1 polysaccharide deacetylase [Agrobacterium vitis]MUZ59336.1 polysaccharide deacetylase [Agrobacterium vitis]MVA67855.1 polysaccharide deacetylase [Agrobacterium vitis]MVA89783.1 polysaccharide deacetylase [Agrobacterium vitis]
MSEILLRQRLDDLAAQEKTVNLWLRDDDAVEPSNPLETLLALARRFQIPLTLAVIPEPTGAALAASLSVETHATIAVHGWNHQSHAGPGEKKQELGGHRPAAIVLDELRQGLAKLHGLYGEKLLPMLVPPWNRIDKALLPALSGLGFTALSVFGREKRINTLTLLNTHVDVMDWHGTRGGRDADILFAELAGYLAPEAEPLHAIGILTHHLVHDQAVWDFLTRLFALTATHPACRWDSARTLLQRQA